MKTQYYLQYLLSSSMNCICVLSAVEKWNINKYKIWILYILQNMKYTNYNNIIIYFFIGIHYFGFCHAVCNTSQLNLNKKIQIPWVIDCTNKNVDMNCTETQAFGAKVILRCSTNYTDVLLRPELEKICLQDGTWSGGFAKPICIVDNGESKSVNPPWRVHLFSGRSTSQQKALCSGALISKDAVLTSAQCLYGIEMEKFNSSDLEVDLNPGSTNFRRVKNFFRSPSESENNLDLALIEIEGEESGTEDEGTNKYFPVYLPSTSNIFRNVGFLQLGDFGQVYHKTTSENFTILSLGNCVENMTCTKFCAATSNSSTFSNFTKEGAGEGFTISSERHNILFGILSENVLHIGNENRDLCFKFINVQYFMPWIEDTLKNISLSKNRAAINEDELSESKTVNNILTWTFIQEQLSKKNRNSLIIINQISYFFHKNIPIEIFQGNELITENEMDLLNNNISSSIVLLKNYSLVNIETTSSSQEKYISILPELQETIRFYLAQNRMIEEQVIRTSIMLLEKQLNKTDVDGSIAIIITHAIVVWKYATNSKYENIVKEFTPFHLNIYDKLNLYGRFNETIEFANQNLDLFIKIYGENHTNVLFIRSKVFYAYIKLDDYDKALKYIHTWANETLLEDENEIAQFIEENKEFLEEEINECFTSFCEMDIPDLCL